MHHHRRHHNNLDMNVVRVLLFLTQPVCVRVCVCVAQQTTSDKIIVERVFSFHFRKYKWNEHELWAFHSIPHHMQHRRRAILIVVSCRVRVSRANVRFFPLKFKLPLFVSIVRHTTNATRHRENGRNYTNTLALAHTHAPRTLPLSSSSHQAPTCSFHSNFVFLYFWPHMRAPGAQMRWGRRRVIYVFSSIFFFFLFVFGNLISFAVFSFFFSFLHLLAIGAMSHCHDPFGRICLCDDDDESRRCHMKLKCWRVPHLVRPFSIRFMWRTRIPLVKIWISAAGQRNRIV